MPFRRLPPDIRLKPEVQDAWHHHHEERISRLSSNDTAPRLVLPVIWLRVALALLLFLTVTGVIKPEIALPLLIAALKLSLGFPP